MNLQIQLEIDHYIEQKTESTEEHWTPADKLQSRNSI